MGKLTGVVHKTIGMFAAIHGGNGREFTPGYSRYIIGSIHVRLGEIFLALSQFVHWIHQEFFFGKSCIYIIYILYNILYIYIYTIGPRFPQQTVKWPEGTRIISQTSGPSTLQYWRSWWMLGLYFSTSAGSPYIVIYSSSMVMIYGILVIYSSSSLWFRRIGSSSHSEWDDDPSWQVEQIELRPCQEEEKEDSIGGRVGLPFRWSLNNWSQGTRTIWETLGEHSGRREMNRK